MNRPCFVLGAALCLLSALPASADVGVSYTVDEQALKAAVSGTNLTFTLYSDSACTTAIGNPISGTIDDVRLIERVRRFTLRGGAKPPKTDRLVHVLPGVTVAGTVFLKVSGTGISPVGGACQLQFSSLPSGALPCASQIGNEVYFTGCNVNVRSGSGTTDGPVNGLGNLVVGYNTNASFAYRGGSHNLIVGDEHGYGSYGGLVAGYQNKIGLPFTSVTGGECNIAGGSGPPPAGCPIVPDVGGFGQTVSGGADNVASGAKASVAGGYMNVASSAASSIAGGMFNQALGGAAAIAGGYNNATNANSATVAGGTNNFAFGDYSSVSGGDTNHANGVSSTIGGGTGVTVGVGVDRQWHASQSTGFPTGTEY